MGLSCGTPAMSLCPTEMRWRVLTVDTFRETSYICPKTGVIACLACATNSAGRGGTLYIRKPFVDFAGWHMFRERYA
jgi:hypothetical protein